MILQGVKLTIQPLQVGFANSPQRAQKGGYVVFSPIYGPAWLRSNNLYEAILGLSGGSWHRLHRPSGHYVGPHGGSSTPIVTK